MAENRNNKRRNVDADDPDNVPGNNQALAGGSRGQIQMMDINENSYQVGQTQSMDQNEDKQLDIGQEGGYVNDGGRQNVIAPNRGQQSLSIPKKRQNSEYGIGNSSFKISEVDQSRMQQSSTLTQYFERQEFTAEEQIKINKYINIIKDDKDAAANDQLNLMNMDQDKLTDGAHFYFPNMNKKFVVYDRKSCYIFHSDGFFRRKIVWLSCWPWFDNLIIMLILLNSILLACYDYNDRESKTARNMWIDSFGVKFTLVFTFECIIKIIAMGFIMHRNSYLRDPWNWLDFIVVCIGVIEVIPGIPNLKFLRTMRVLRPLRSVNAFPQIRRLVRSLLSSIPELGSAVVFLLFIFLLFGILGVQKYKGVFYQRCRDEEMPTLRTGHISDTKPMWYWTKSEEVDRLCSIEQGEGHFVCPTGLTCGSATASGISNPPKRLNNSVTDGLLLTEEYGNDELISFNIMNFNNLIYAMQTIFVMITLEGWSSLMYNLSDASTSWMAILFCVLCVVLGSFFLLNVILAVIMESFDSVDRKQDLLEEQQSKFLKAQKKAFGIEDDTSEADSKDGKSSQSDSQSSINENEGGQRSDGDDPKQSQLNPRGFKQVGIARPKTSQTNVKDIRDKNMSLKAHVKGMTSIQQSSNNNRNNVDIHNLQTIDPEQRQTTRNNDIFKSIEFSIPQEMDKNEGQIAEQVQNYESIDQMNPNKDEYFTIKKQHVIPQFSKAKTQIESSAPKEKSPTRSTDRDHKKQKLSRMLKNDDSIPSCLKCQIKMYMKVRKRMKKACSSSLCKVLSGHFSKVVALCYKLCMHDGFTIAMTAAILINTLVLAFDHYPIEYKTLQAVEFVNKMLTFLFIVEMVVKVTGMGVNEYCNDQFNIFDGVIVFTSIVEMIIENFFQADLAGGAISSLRAVRLLRVFKLARSWTSFRDLLAKMIVTFKDIQYFAMLLILFMFIFTLLGMELFAFKVNYNNSDKERPVDEFYKEGFYPRASFNDFPTGFTTIFIVFIGEDWNSVMYDHARSQGHYVIPIFIFIFIVGNLILLNLFLAILLKNFEEPPGKEESPANDDDNKSAKSNKSQGLFQKLTMQLKNQMNVDSDNSQDSPDKSSRSNQSKLKQGMLKGLTMNLKNQFDQKKEQNELKSKESLVKQSQGLLGRLSAKINNITIRKSDVIFDKSAIQESPEREEESHRTNRATNQASQPGEKVNNNEENSLQCQINRRTNNTSLDQDQRTAQKIDMKFNQTHENQQVSVKRSLNRLAQSQHVSLNQSLVSISGLDSSPKLKQPPPLLESIQNIKSTINKEQTQSRRLTISDIKQMEVEASQKTKRKVLTVTGKSLEFFDPQHKLRKFCVLLVGHENFDNVILFLIVMSTLLLTLESPLNDPNSKRADVIFYLEQIFTVLFTMEMMIKVVVFGFITNGPDSYMRSAWNIMDFIIVDFSLISIFFSGSNLGAIKTLRMLRVLRPLRMISRNPGLKIAVNALMNAIPFLGDIIVVSLLFLLLFAILCTNFYKGTFFSCHVNEEILEGLPEGVVTELLRNIDEHVHTKFQCLDYGGDWVNSDSNFDNVYLSMISLFNIMTTEGWIDVMWSAVDASQIDHIPIMNQFNLSVVYFLIIIFFFHLFILNMFVGIVINVFSDEKKTLEMNHLLTQTQLEWCEVIIKSYQSQPIKKFLTTGNIVKDTCYAIAIQPFFDRFILLCIILNTVCLAFTWFGEPADLQDRLDGFNLTFNIIYTIEAIIKLIAFGKDFFNEGWNNFDLMIVLAAWFGKISETYGINVGASTNVIRMLRISRIFKIVKKYKSLRVLFQTSIGAIPQLTNVGGLLMLFLFMYTVLGVELFAKVKLQENLSVHANFQTFGTALTTLLRMATGESWQAIMYDCARQRTVTFECVDKPTYEDMFVGENEPMQINGCGDALIAYLYFISFMIVVSFVFLNLFIAIILESFDSSNAEESMLIGSDTINVFNELWSNDQFDPKGTKFISTKKINHFLLKLIDEEIKARYRYQESIANGDIGQSLDDEINATVFLFNIVPDLIIYPIFQKRQLKIYKEIVEAQSNDQDDKTTFLKRLSSELTKYDSKEGGEKEQEPKRDPKQERINRKRDAKLEEQQLEHIEKIVGKLHLPCYDNCQTYYYYDVLVALSRRVFQQLVTKKKQKIEEEIQQKNQRMNGDAEKGNQSSNDSLELNSSQRRRREQQRNDQAILEDQTMKSNDDQNELLTERQQEDRNDIMSGNFEEILYRLEEKGSQKNDIKIYMDMRDLRVKMDNEVKDRLMLFDYDDEDKKLQIIDSSQIASARIIAQHWKYFQRKGYAPNRQFSFRLPQKKTTSLRELFSQGIRKKVELLQKEQKEEQYRILHQSQTSKYQEVRSYISQELSDLRKKKSEASQPQMTSNLISSHLPQIKETQKEHEDWFDESLGREMFVEPNQIQRANQLDDDLESGDQSIKDLSKLLPDKDDSFKHSDVVNKKPTNKIGSDFDDKVEDKQAVDIDRGVSISQALPKNSFMIQGHKPTMAFNNNQEQSSIDQALNHDDYQLARFSEKVSSSPENSAIKQNESSQAPLNFYNQQRDSQMDDDDQRSIANQQSKEKEQIQSNNQDNKQAFVRRSGGSKPVQQFMYICTDPSDDSD